MDVTARAYRIRAGTQPTGVWRGARCHVRLKMPKQPVTPFVEAGCWPGFLYPDSEGDRV
jgi:hypothetical protein